MKKIVLAYSGGLDTSIILRWLQENYEAEVIAYTSDIGQEINRKKIIANAKRLGVKKVIIEDTTVDNFIMRHEVSIIIRNYFRKTWIWSNNILILLIYSYLRGIFDQIQNYVGTKISRQRKNTRQHQNFWQQEVQVQNRSKHQELSNSTPLCFKLLFSISLGLVDLYYS